MGKGIGGHTKPNSGLGERGKSNSGGPSVLVAYGEANKQALKNCTLSGAYIGLK